MTGTARHASKLTLLILLLAYFFQTNCEKAILEPSGVLEVCADGNVTFVCSVDDTNLLVLRSGDNNFMFFSKSTEVDMVPQALGDFTFLLISTSPSIVVNITLTNGFNSRQNGTNLTCSSHVNTTVTPSQGDFAFLTLKVNPPAVPTDLKFLPRSLSYSVLSWAPPTGFPCATRYAVTLLNITEGNVTYMYNTTADATSLNLTDLTQGAQYSFTVAVVDALDQIGNDSNPSDVVTFDTPERITGLQSYNQQGNISFSWMPPPLSSRPPIIGYSISHNTTGHIVVNQTNDTTFTVEGIGSGVYAFYLSAFNVLGDGQQEIHVVEVPVMSTSSAKESTESTTDIESNTVVAIPSDQPSPQSPSQLSTSITTVPAGSLVDLETAQCHLSISLVRILVYVLMRFYLHIVLLETATADPNLYIFVALGVITLIVIVMAILLFVLMVISIRNRKGSAKTSEQPDIKESATTSFCDKQMSFSENQAYSSNTHLPTMAKYFTGQEVLYDVIK